LYEIAIDAILNYWKTDLDMRPSERGRVPDISPLRIRILNQAFYYVRQMNIEPAISSFSIWCDDTKIAMLSSPEWHQLLQMNLSDDKHNERAFRIILKYVSISLSNTILERLIKEHPALKELVEQLELEVDFDHLITELNEEE
jgi:hypothetical protein